MSARRRKYRDDKGIYERLDSNGSPVLKEQDRPRGIVGRAVARAKESAVTAQGERAMTAGRRHAHDPRRSDHDEHDRAPSAERDLRAVGG